MKLKWIDPAGRLSYTGQRLDLNKMRERLKANRAERRGVPSTR